MDVLELPRERTDELKGFLSKDPFQHLYALGMLEEHGVGGGVSGRTLAFHALLDDGKLAAVAMVGGAGGLVIPCAADPAMCAELGRQLSGKLKLRGVLGEKANVDAFLRALACGPARWSRPQKLFVASADDLGPFVTPELRPAVASDLPQLVAMSAAALREAIGEDPLAHDPGSFNRRIEARVAAGRTWVLPEAGKLVVKIDVGARSRFGAELEGLYTLPEARRRKLATKALGQLCRSLLSSLPRLAMRVDEKDVGLAATCRHVGFSVSRLQRLVVVG